MPTLEDTVEFQAITLNDLLEADARAGVGEVGADDSKYRLWFMVSSAAAGIFAILFVVALVTGGGDGGDSGGSTGNAVKLEGDLQAVPVTAAGQLPPGLAEGQVVSLLKDGKVLVSGVKVVGVRSGDPGLLGQADKIVDVAANPEQQLKIATAGPMIVQPGALPLSEDKPADTATTTATAPAGEAPVPAPAPSPNG